MPDADLERDPSGATDTIGQAGEVSFENASGTSSG